jgi:hypothetical protein
MLWSYEPDTTWPVNVSRGSERTRLVGSSNDAVHVYLGAKVLVVVPGRIMLVLKMSLIGISAISRGEPPTTIEKSQGITTVRRMWRSWVRV